MPSCRICCHGSGNSDHADFGHVTQVAKGNVCLPKRPKVLFITRTIRIMLDLFRLAY